MTKYVPAIFHLQFSGSQRIRTSNVHRIGNGITCAPPQHLQRCRTSKASVYGWLITHKPIYRRTLCWAWPKPISESRRIRTSNVYPKGTDLQSVTTPPSLPCSHLCSERDFHPYVVDFRLLRSHIPTYLKPYQHYNTNKILASEIPPSEHFLKKFRDTRAVVMNSISQMISAIYSHFPDHNARNVNNLRLLSFVCTPIRIRTEISRA